MMIHGETLERKTTRFICRIVGVVALGLLGQSAWAQTTEKPALTPMSRVDTNPDAMIPLKNVASVNEANEIVVAIRNMLDPSFKVYLVPSQNAIMVRGTNEQIALAQKIVSQLDRPKKAYRLTYTITDIDGGKRIGVQHFSTIAVEGQRSVLKQVSKVPVVTGSYNNASSQAESQVTYLDVGLIFDATLASSGNGVSLRAKVERSSVAEERSGVGPQDPVVRSTSVEGDSLLVPGKPVVLGSLDIPGSTRHLDVDVMIEPLGQ